MGTITVTKYKGGEQVSKNTIESRLEDNPTGVYTVDSSVDNSPEVQETKYTEEYLESLSFNALKEIGQEFDVTHRSSVGLIEEILEAQENADEDNSEAEDSKE